MSTEPIALLCITAHPDDVELCMGGTVCKHVAKGHRVGIVDLSAGELGTRGTAQLRRQEAEVARGILGAEFRYQLDLADGFFIADKPSLLKVVSVLRAHRPQVVITNALHDRHPDHARAAQLVAQACFLSGLHKVTTEANGVAQEHWRPRMLLHGIQDQWMEPSLIVDVSPYWSQRMRAAMAFKSQLFDPTSTEPDSPISSKEFLDGLTGRALQFGRSIGVAHGEGFVAARTVGVEDLTLLQ
jgi:N-acetylglucosamine malate deacetylase 1